MPETPMNKDCRPLAGKDKIGFAWQISPVKSKAITRLMKKPAHGHFRRSIFRFHRAHDCATLFGAEYVHRLRSQSAQLRWRRGAHCFTLENACRFVNAGEDICINPFNDRDAHAISKAREGLIDASLKIELGRSL
jgi:hypothetical protein